MTGQSATPQVLGASTSLAAGIAVLPNTSGSPLLFILSLLLIVLGIAVLVSLIASKIIVRRINTKE